MCIISIEAIEIINVKLLFSIIHIINRNNILYNIIYIK